MYLLIHHLAIQYLEGIQFRFSIKQREDSVADGWIVGQTQVFLRRARGRGGMTVPVGENLQTFLTCIAQGGKLVFWREGKCSDEWSIFSIQ